MKLLLIAPSTRAMAESAKRAGYDFISLDFFGDADQKEICENYSLKHEFKEERCIENLFKHAQGLSFTHVVYGSGFENHPELVAGFEKRCTAQACTVLGNDSKTIEKVRNWNYFFKNLKKEGILYPETEAVPLEKARELIKSEEKIIKPIKSGGGHLIYDKQNFEPSGEELRSEVLVQQYIPGKPVSSTVIASKKECLFIGATEQLVGTPFNKYKYTGNIAPLEEKIKEIEEISYKIARIFKLIGSNGIDFIIKDSELYVLEVNPRISGSMEALERAHDVNIFDLHVKACLGENLDLKIKKPKKFWGKKILFAERNLRYKLKKLDFIKDVPHYNEEINERDPVCTVLGSGKSRRECYLDLLEKEEKVRTGL